MLPDPLGITYDSVAHSLPRAAFEPKRISRVLDSHSYVTSNGEFVVTTTAYSIGKFDVRVEIILRRIIPDTDSDPFNGVNTDQFGNGFGYVLELNKFRYASTTDIPKLRTAINTLVDSTLLGRLIGGEI
jgi:hypothetical protein